MPVMQPSFDPDHFAEPGDGGIGGIKEEVHAHAKQQGIEQAGDDDPFPQLVFAYKLVGLGIGLDGYNDFFKQGSLLFFSLFV